MLMHSQVWAEFFISDIIDCSNLLRNKCLWWSFINSMRVHSMLMQFLFCHCIHIESKFFPEPHETTTNEFVSNMSWNINCSNLGSFPEEWLKPREPNDRALICSCCNKDNTFEACSNWDSISDNWFTITLDIKNWSSKINLSSSKLCSLSLLNLSKRHRLICTWSNFIIDC